MKMKNKLFPSLLLLLAALLVACHQGSEGQQGGTYLVSGQVVADSMPMPRQLMLYADRHNSLHADTIRLDSLGHFACQLHTHGLDELYLCDDSGELARFYATEGMEVNMRLRLGREGVTTTFEPAADSINVWLQECGEQFEGRTASIMRRKLEQLGDTSIRATLLLRNLLTQFDDSVFVRQYLGGLPAAAKPEWLTASISHILAEKSTFRNRNRRLEQADFALSDDSTHFFLGASRTDYLLVCCWADYSKPSIDSLQMLDSLLRKDYVGKRVKLLSLCLHAPDSLWWREHIEGMTGMHSWVKGALADPRMSDWGVKGVPEVLLLDMYNNRQLRNDWGTKLRKALDRLPRKLNTN